MSAVVFYGDGMVWDAERHDVLCQFVDGKYETKDAREIRILSATYKHDAIEADVQRKRGGPRGTKD